MALFFFSDQMNGRSFGLEANFKPSANSLLPYCARKSHTCPSQLPWSSHLLLQPCKIIGSLFYYTSERAASLLGLCHWHLREKAIMICWSFHTAGNATLLLLCEVLIQPLWFRVTAQQVSMDQPWCLSPSRSFLAIQKTKQDLTLFRHLDFLACTHAQRAEGEKCLLFLRVEVYTLVSGML